MRTYKVKISDFSDDNYSLIGVHTFLEDYKLAYLINKHLNTRFIKSDYDLGLDKECPICSIYEYEDCYLDINWLLISNRYTVVSKSFGFFGKEIATPYLIPEKKKVNYFLKIEGDIQRKQLIKSIEEINKIPQIITSYVIDATTLKSKKNLIF